MLTNIADEKTVGNNIGFSDNSVNEPINPKLSGSPFACNMSATMIISPNGKPIFEKKQNSSSIDLELHVDKDIVYKRADNLEDHSLLYSFEFIPTMIKEHFKKSVTNNILYEIHKSFIDICSGRSFGENPDVVRTGKAYCNNLLQCPFTGREVGIDINDCSVFYLDDRGSRIISVNKTALIQHNTDLQTLWNLRSGWLNLSVRDIVQKVSTILRPHLINSQMSSSATSSNQFSLFCSVIQNLTERIISGKSFGV